MNIDAPAAAIAEMERNMGLHEDVLRFMTVSVEALEEVLRPFCAMTAIRVPNVANVRLAVATARTAPVAMPLRPCLTTRTPERSAPNVFLTKEIKSCR